MSLRDRISRLPPNTRDVGMGHRGDEFIWTHEEFTMRDVVENFKSHLPFLVNVTDGYMGRDEQHTIASEQIYWLYSLAKQRRLVARSDDRYISLPVDLPQTVNGYWYNGAEMRGITIKQVLSGKCDYFTFASDEGLQLFDGADDSEEWRFSQLHVVGDYTEPFFVAHSLIGGTLCEQEVIIPSYMPITVSLAMGLALRSRPAMEKTVHDFTRLSNSFTHGAGKPCHDIMIFRGKPKEGDYEYFQHKRLLSGLHRGADCIDKIQIRLAENRSYQIMSRPARPRPPPAANALPLPPRKDKRLAAATTVGLTPRKSIKQPSTRSPKVMGVRSPQLTERVVLQGRVRFVEDDYVSSSSDEYDDVESIYSFEYTPKIAPAAGPAAAAAKGSLENTVFGPCNPPKSSSAARTALPNQATSVSPSVQALCSQIRDKHKQTAEKSVNWASQSPPQSPGASVSHVTPSQAGSPSKMTIAPWTGAPKTDPSYAYSNAAVTYGDPHPVPRLAEERQRSPPVQTVRPYRDTIATTNLAGQTTGESRAIITHGSARTNNANSSPAAVAQNNVNKAAPPTKPRRKHLEAKKSAVISRGGGIGSFAEVPADLGGMSVNQVGHCLALLHMNTYAKDFAEQLIDGQMLCTIDEDLLIHDLGLTHTHAKKLMMFVGGWRPNTLGD